MTLAFCSKHSGSYDQTENTIIVAREDNPAIIKKVFQANNAIKDIEELKCLDPNGWIPRVLIENYLHDWAQVPVYGVAHAKPVKNNTTTQVAIVYQDSHYAVIVFQLKKEKFLLLDPRGLWDLTAFKNCSFNHWEGSVVNCYETTDNHSCGLQAVYITQKIIEGVQPQDIKKPISKEVGHTKKQRTRLMPLYYQLMLLRAKLFLSTYVNNSVPCPTCHKVGLDA